MRDPIAASELLLLPVRVRGIELGRPVELLLDDGERRAVGLDLVCGDDARRFLPLGAGHVGSDEIEVDSALVLLEEGDLAFYRRHGRELGDLTGAAVERGRHRLGVLLDVVVAADGTIAELMLETGVGRLHVAYDDDVRIVSSGRSAAA